MTTMSMFPSSPFAFLYPPTTGQEPATSTSDGFSNPSFHCTSSVSGCSDLGPGKGTPGTFFSAFFGAAGAISGSECTRSCTAPRRVLRPAAGVALSSAEPSSSSSCMLNVLPPFDSASRISSSSLSVGALYSDFLGAEELVVATAGAASSAPFSPPVNSGTSSSSSWSMPSNSGTSSSSSSSSLSPDGCWSIMGSTSVLCAAYCSTSSSVSGSTCFAFPFRDCAGSASTKSAAYLLLRGSTRGALPFDAHGGVCGEGGKTSARDAVVVKPAAAGRVGAGRRGNFRKRPRKIICLAAWPRWLEP